MAAIVAGLVDVDLDADAVGTPAAAQQAKAKVAELKAAASAARTEEDIADLEELLAEAARTGTAAEERALAHDREAEAARERAAARRADLVAQLGDSPDLATALDRTGRIAEAAEAAADALDALARSQKAAETADAEALTAALGAGFATIDAARAALREPTWRAEAKAAIEAHRTEVDGNAALLADPDLDVDLTRPADVPAAEAAEALAAAEHDRAVRAESLAKRQVKDLDRRVPELSALLADLPTLQERAATVARACRSDGRSGGQREADDAVRVRARRPVGGDRRGRGSASSADDGRPVRPGAHRRRARGEEGAAWACWPATTGPASTATPPPCPAERPSWRPSPWRWPWPTSSARNPEASAWSPCSSTRASARSMRTPSTR